jgi:hypothetical protein
MPFSSLPMNLLYLPTSSSFPHTKFVLFPSISPLLLSPPCQAEYLLTFCQRNTCVRINVGKEKVEEREKIKEEKENERISIVKVVVHTHGNRDIQWTVAREDRTLDKAS